MNKPTLFVFATRCFISFFSISIIATPAFAQGAPQGPTPVFVSLVETKPFVDELDTLGSLQANENVEVNATVTELVTKVNFDDGQRVAKGDVLVEMDAAEELAERAEEQSRLAEAKRQYQRLKPLAAKGSASEAALDERQREMQTAAARLQAIQSRINQRIVLAPFDGIVGLRNISVGTLAQPGTRLTTIDDDSVMKLDFPVPEIFLAALKVGIQVTATTKAYPNETFSGTLTSIDSRIDPISRSITARAMLDNSDQKLKPGLLMRVTLQKNPRDTLVIPEEALLARGEQAYVFVVDETDGKTSARRQDLTLGARRKGEAEVLEGLSEGQQVITHGNLRVRSGSQVAVKATEKGNESLAELLEQSTDASGDTP